MRATLDSIFAFNYYSGLEFHDITLPFYELVYFINGRGTTRINETTYNYGPHTLCFTKPSDTRNSICIKATDYICIRFHSNDLSDELLSGVYTCAPSDILNLFMKVQKEVHNKEFNYLAICNLTIEEIFYNLTRAKVLDDKDQAFLNLIKDIDQNCAKNRSIKSMADSVSYSYDHFRHRFKELTGQAPTNYIINKRVEKACLLLQQNTLSCTEISLICGFSSSAQFSTMFKRTIGYTPVEYKKNFK